MGWLVSFFHLRLCLFSLALSIAAIVLAQLLATSLLLGNLERKKHIIYIYISLHPCILGAFLPFANVTLNAFACEKNSLSFCQVCGQVFVVIFQADSRTRNIFVAAGHPV